MRRPGPAHTSAIGLTAAADAHRHGDLVRRAEQKTWPSLGYEHHDARLPDLGGSFVSRWPGRMVDGCPRCGAGSPRLAQSR